MATGRKELNNNVQRDRLNKETQFGMRQSELVSKVREEKSKNFSRLAIGHKSNSLVLNEAAARLGQSMRETEDELIRDMLAGTASVINCTGGTNGDNPTEITRGDVDNVIATLQNNDADFITNMIGGEDKFGTGPIRDAYFALSDTNMIGQFENVNGFIAKAQYPNQQGVLSAEWGSISNTRIYVSSRGSVTTNGSLLGADIYNVFIGGQESYAKIEQNGVSARFIYHPPGHGRNVAVYKSFLMDLELSSCDDGDDKAQAAYECAA
jgi:N4-gp56 family major capsid protein